MNVTDTLEQIRSHLIDIAKQGGDELAAEARDWANIAVMASKDVLADRMTPDRYAMLLNQARTTLQLNGANMLAAKEAALLAGLQEALLKVAAVAVA